jgi:hypothetical protein
VKFCHSDSLSSTWLGKGKNQLLSAFFSKSLKYFSFEAFFIHSIIKKSKELFVAENSFNSEVLSFPNERVSRGEFLETFCHSLLS